MDTPQVSVIMPAFNAADFIRDSIESVRKQTFKNWELLIIEDASNDTTAEIAAHFQAEDARIKIHSLPTNQGAAFARNIGIKASRGDYISFLDADDLWNENKLEVQINFMIQNKIDICYSSYEIIDEEGVPKMQKIEALPNLTFDKLLKANYIGNLTGVYNAKKLGKIYSPLIRKRQDWGLWLLALKKAGFAKGIQEPLALYRQRKNSISQNKVEMLQYNFLVYRKVLGFSLLKSSYYLCTFLFEQFFVKNKQKSRLE